MIFCMNQTAMAGRLLVFSLAITPLSVMANDSILVHKMEYETGWVHFEKGCLSNPALTHLLPVNSLSMISIVGISQPSSLPRIPQLGSGGRNFKVNASSFQLSGQSNAVWGNASYENGQKYNIVWNETSDFLQVFPYVMADSRGGDLKYEEYKLEGGYSARHRKLHYGINVGYRALQEYRDHDPRPNNNVADLHAQVGFGYNAHKDYIFAIAVEAGKYKQTNELAYYNELGAQMEYHLTGIGNDFSRFSGQSNNTFFKGYSLGGELNLTNRKCVGWSVSAGYLFTQMEKILTDLNRLPLNKLNIDAFRGSVGYNTHSYGIRLCGHYVDRKGNDNLFGDATGSIYPQIGTKRQYVGRMGEVRTEGFWTIKGFTCFTFNIEPKLAYLSIVNRHHSSGNHLKSDDLQFGVCGKMDYRKKNNVFSISLEMARRQNLSTDLVLYNSVSTSLSNTLDNINKYFKDGETRFSLGLEYTRKVWNNKAVAFGFRWQHACYVTTSDNCYEGKLAFYL